VGDPEVGENPGFHSPEPWCWQTEDVPRESDPYLGAALAELQAEDPAAAGEAEAALHSLTNGEGVEAITQERLQRFLWYELPVEWTAGPERTQRIVHALARLLDLLGLDRYAAICRSEATAEVLQAYRTSRSRGLDAFRRADTASGIRPPDLVEFGWGPLMGPAEDAAFSSTAEFLEMAVAAGELVPGARGWHARQHRLVRDHLAAPRTELDGQSFLELVVAERLDWWLTARRSATRRALMAAVTEHLQHPVELPAGADDPLPPLRWLLEQAAEGVTLTQTGNLNRAFVQAAAELFGWWEPGMNPPRSEEELLPLRQIRLLAQRLGLVRRKTRVLGLTSRGRSSLNDPGALWRTVAHHFFAGDPFTITVGEVVFALLVDTEPMPDEEIISAVGRIVTEEGWRDARTGAGPGEREVSRAVDETLSLCRALNLLATGGHWDDPGYSLTEVGRATALEALRFQATGPRTTA
jgi:hypothetical protein